MADIWVCFYCGHAMEEPELLGHLSSTHNVTTAEKIDIEYTGSRKSVLEHTFWCVPSDRHLRNGAAMTRRTDR